MEIQKPRRRERRGKNQTFYPLPASFSEADQYEYSSDDEDGSSYDGDGDGFKNTLVRWYLSLLECAMIACKKHDFERK